MAVLAGIRFRERGPSRLYTKGDLVLAPGDFCVVEDSGEEVTGGVSCFETRWSECPCSRNPYPPILRKASDKEIERWRQLRERERQAFATCKQKVRERDLPMNVSTVRVFEKQNKISFTFTADRRIDFRELVKDLASALKARIELWQVGVRDEAKNMDGYGICGRRLCCSAWIQEFKAITIRMAKDQEIALAPSKLSGCCGRLMCCMEYEDAQYRDMAAEMPSVGAVIESVDFKGQVVERRLLGGWTAVRDQNGDVYQVFNNEVVRVLSEPGGRKVAESQAAESPLETDEIKGELEEGEEMNGAAIEGKNGADAGPGGAPTVLYAARGGVPPRHPRAIEREETQRAAEEHKRVEDFRRTQTTAPRADETPPPPEREDWQPSAVTESAPENEPAGNGDGRASDHRSRRGRRGGHMRRRRDDGETAPATAPGDGPPKASGPAVKPPDGGAGEERGNAPQPKNRKRHGRFRRRPQARRPSSHES